MNFKNGIIVFLKWVIIISAVIFFICLGLYTVWRTHYGSTDFDTYYYAAREITSGSSVYKEHEGVSPYIYPPFFASFLAPLAVFNMEIASFIWYAMNIIFFFLAIQLSFLLIFKMSDYRKIWDLLPFMPKALFIGIAIGLFIDNISMLQVNILVCSAIIAGFYFFKKRMDFLAGLFFGLAISIKIIPVLFLIYFVVKREFRMCVLTFLWIIIFSIAVPSFYIGPTQTWQSLLLWSKSMLFKSTSFTPNDDMIMYMFNPENQSLTAFLSRWLIKNDFHILHLKRAAHEFPPFMITWTVSMTKGAVIFLSKVITSLITAVTFVFCLKKSKDRDSFLLNYEYSLVLLLSLIANPVLKTQQLVLIVFPMVFMLCRIAQSDRDYKYFYTAFIWFSIFYIAQAIRLFRVFGFGTLSILWLWLVIMVKKIEIEKEGLH